MSAVADGVDPAITTVERYMTRDPIGVTPDTEVAQAAMLMLQLGVRHLPVMVGQEVMGMLSARDLMADLSWNAEPAKQEVPLPVRRSPYET